MAFLKYTMPSNLPCYTDWDFPMFPGTFLFSMTDIIAVFQKHIEKDSKYAHNWSKDSGIYKEYLDCQDVLKWLQVNNCNGNKIVEWDDSVRDLYWSMSQPLVYGGNYLDVHCPACSKSYKPEHMTQHIWVFGEGLVASGGRRLACPNGHTVYSIMEWNS